MNSKTREMLAKGYRKWIVHDGAMGDSVWAKSGAEARMQVAKECAAQNGQSVEYWFKFFKATPWTEEMYECEDEE